MQSQIKIKCLSCDICVHQIYLSSISACLFFKIKNRKHLPPKFPNLSVPLQPQHMASKGHQYTLVAYPEIHL